LTNYYIFWKERYYTACLKAYKRREGLEGTWEFCAFLPDLRITANLFNETARLASRFMERGCSKDACHYAALRCVMSFLMHLLGNANSIRTAS